MLNFQIFCYTGSHIKLIARNLMKKIPILLSTLTLTTSAALLTRSMTALANGVAEGTGISLRDTAFEAPQTAEDTIYTERNIYDNRVEVYVNPLKNEMTFNFDQLGDDWVRRIVLVQHNYEEGVLESEADERMKTLGIDDYIDWATKVDDWDNNLTGRYPFRPSSHDLRLERYVSNTLQSGRPNFFYYAVQFWHRSTGENGENVWDNSYWIRGKIDLRNCVRSSVLTSSVMTCVADQKINGEPYKFVLSRNNTLVLMPVEKIPTWDEEWQEIILKRHKQVTDDVKILHRDVLTGMKLIESYKVEIEKIRTIMSKSNSNADRLYELTRAEKQIEEVKDFYEQLASSGSDSDEMEALQSENIELKKKIETLEANFAKTNQEKQALEANLDESKRELADMVGQNTLLRQENSNLRKQIAEFDQTGQEDLLGENESLRQQNQTLRGELKQSEAVHQEEMSRLQNEIAEKVKVLESEKQSLAEARRSSDIANLTPNKGVVRETEKNEPKTEISEEVISDDEMPDVVPEVVDVPNLGAVETKSWLWWLILPLMGILMLGIAIRQMFFKKH